MNFNWMNEVRVELREIRDAFSTATTSDAGWTAFSHFTVNSPIYDAALDATDAIVQGALEFFNNQKEDI